MALELKSYMNIMYSLPLEEWRGKRLVWSVYVFYFGSNWTILAVFSYVLINILSVGSKSSSSTEICLVNCKFVLSWFRCPLTVGRMFLMSFSKFSSSMPGQVTSCPFWIGF